MTNVRYEIDGAIATVTIDRPQVRNAVDGPTRIELADAFRRFDADDALAVAILTGANGTFCAGADLKGVADGGGNRVTVGFRPEHTELVSDPAGAVPMVVELVEELGSDAYVHGHAKLNGEDNTKDTLVVRTDGRNVPRMGEMVYVRPREGSQHVFHAETGVRL